jgi:hypothetical protein
MNITYEEAVKTIPCGRYRHFKGNEYEVIGIARHSETEEPMVVYRALYGEGGLWTRPAAMWNEQVTRAGKTYHRFYHLDRIERVEKYERLLDEAVVSRARRSSVSWMPITLPVNGGRTMKPMSGANCPGYEARSVVSRRAV